MCYIGAPFEHDVFVSYAHAEKDTGAPLLLRWSHHFVDRITEFLETYFNPGQSVGSRIDVFIDKNRFQSGDKLPQELRKAVEKSAFLLVLMSPSYPISTWCKEELEHHFAKADRDGRSGHCVIVRAQHLPDNAWPDRLKDDRGGPVLYRDLVNPETQLPLGLDDDFEDPRLKAGVKQVFIEIRQKLEAYNKYMGDRRVYADIPRIPVSVRAIVSLLGRRHKKRRQ
jgi:TIR domain